MKWAWAVVVAVIALAGGILVFRVVTAPDAPGIGVRTVTRTPQPVPTTTTTTTTPQFTDPNPDRVTEVVEVVAIDKAGNPAAGYQIADGGEVENCLPSPAGTDTGIVTCSPSAAGAGVCWVTPALGVLLCGDEPWGKSLRRMTTADLVNRTSLGGEAQPWGLELADGAKCQRRNGSLPVRPDGLTGAYLCDRENKFVFVGDAPLVNRTKRTWTVKVGGMIADNRSFPPPVDMRVVKAYFAASP